MSQKRSVNADKDRKAPAKPFVIDDPATQPCYLADLLTKDITNSGSFDIRGDIWATTFCKLLDALPIPGMLLDECLSIIAINQACGKISPQYESILSTRFSRLLSSASNGGSMKSIVQEVFATRKPAVVGTSLRIGTDETMRCRMTFRSIRIGQERFLLVMIEDLSLEKKQLAAKEKRQPELQKSHREMEERSKVKTARSSPADKDPRNGVMEPQKEEGPLNEIVSTIESQLRELKEEIIIRLRLSLQPLIDQLRAETASESGRHLLQALDYHLANTVASLGGKPMRELALLTPREVQICNLIASGLTSKQIAVAMKVTVDAVYSHRLHIRKKVGLDLSGEPLATWLRFRYGL